MDEHLRGRALLIVAIALVAFTGWGWWHEHDTSKAAERVALAHRLALHAAELRDSDPRTARALGLAAVKIHADAQTRAGLTNTVLAWDRESLGVDGVDEVALSGDGRVALAVGHDRAQVVTLASGRTRTLGERKALVRVSALSPDGRTALVGEDGGATTVWNLADRARPARIGALSPSIHTATALALSADGRTLVVGRLERGAEWKSQAAIWNLADPVGPTTAAFIEPSDGEVAGAALSSDGKTALLVGEYGGVSLWDLSTPSEPVRPAGLPRLSAGGTVALSADAGIALTTEAGGLVSRWDLGRLHDVAADPARGLCEHDGQSMSRSDWDRFTGGARPSDYGESDELDFVFLCGLGSR
ncbi:MAG: WD40 repeat domain-containing protein [Nonomuraea sp.]|nr:WD40 repeat domain-containing protein [Nonomuraea sp.]